MEESAKDILLPFLNKTRDAFIGARLVGGCNTTGLLERLNLDASEKFRELRPEELNEWLFKWKDSGLIQCHLRQTGVTWHGCYPMDYLTQFMDKDMLRSVKAVSLVKDSLNNNEQAPADVK
jgi:hypothetical protein